MYIYKFYLLFSMTLNLEGLFLTADLEVLYQLMQAISKKKNICGWKRMIS